MTDWKPGRGLLGPLRPLVGAWTSSPDAQDSRMPVRCVRILKPFGKSWIELDARWDMGPRGEYREVAFLGSMSDGVLGFYSFTNDGKRSEGRLANGSDVHPQAVAFEAEMPAGTARMIYWPLEGGDGFNFAVENRTKAGWSRFLRQEFRPAEQSG